MAESPTVALVPLAALHPAPWNPRTIRDERFKNLCDSIQADPAFIWRRPILAQLDGTIYAGNMRYRAAEHLGMADVPAIVEDVPDTLAKERALRDNAQWGDWQDDELARLLAELQDAESNLDLLGIEEADLKKLLAGPKVELTDPDAVPPTPDEPTTKPGDLWLLGEHRLLCGDATKAEDVGRLMNGERAAFGFTSFPYAVGLPYESYDDTIENLRALLDGTIPLLTAMVRDGGFVTLNFGDIVSAKAMLGTAEVCEYPMALEYWPRMRAEGWTLHTRRIWVKPIGSTVCPWTASSSRGSTEWEHLWTWKRPGIDQSRRTPISQFGVWEYSRFTYETNVLAHHPGAFPVYIVEAGLPVYSDDHDVVIDPFVGSGTTLIACERLGRRCYAIEIEPRYVDVAVRRWEEFTGQKAVLDAAAD